MSAVYLTARWGRLDEMRLHREALVSAGHSVTSRWLDEAEGTQPAEAALVDLDDIRVSDYLIAFTESKEVGYYTGGRHVELGFALAQSHVQIILVGGRENVFCHLPSIKVAHSLQMAIQMMV